MVAGYLASHVLFAPPTAPAWCVLLRLLGPSTAGAGLWPRRQGLRLRHAGQALDGADTVDTWVHVVCLSYVVGSHVAALSSRLGRFFAGSYKKALCVAAPLACVLAGVIISGQDASLRLDGAVSCPRCWLMQLRQARAVQL